MTDVTEQTYNAEFRVYKAKSTRVATVVVYMYTLHVEADVFVNHLS